MRWVGAAVLVSLSGCPTTDPCGAPFGSREYKNDDSLVCCRRPEHCEGNAATPICADGFHCEAETSSFNFHAVSKEDAMKETPFDLELEGCTRVVTVDANEDHRWDPLPLFPRLVVEPNEEVFIVLQRWMSDGACDGTFRAQGTDAAIVRVEGSCPSIHIAADEGGFIQLDVDAPSQSHDLFVSRPSCGAIPGL